MSTFPLSDDNVWFRSPHGKPISLEGLFQNQSAFLLCSGPSLSQHDLSQLSCRGILTCAVNNAASVFRPQLWVSVDGPERFCDGIWRDPGIIKFVPSTNFEKTIRIRATDGQLQETDEQVRQMPAVCGIELVGGFAAERWLTEPGCCWGNSADQTDATGITGVRSVMMVALKILFVLGIRRVYLLGCDFLMSYGKKNYVFEQDRQRAAVRANNHAYRVLNTRFATLKPYFDAAGLEVFNCNPKSGLVAFPHKRFEDAVAEATSKMPAELVTAGMYDAPDAAAAEKGSSEKQA